jgi:hypothetical protein
LSTPIKVNRQQQNLINSFNNYMYPGIKSERQRLDRDIQQFRAMNPTTPEAAKAQYESEMVVDSNAVCVYDEYAPNEEDDDKTEQLFSLDAQPQQQQQHASSFSLYAYANGMRPGMPLERWAEYLASVGSYLSGMYNYFPGSSDTTALDGEYSPELLLIDNDNDNDNGHNGYNADNNQQARQNHDACSCTSNGGCGVSAHQQPNSSLEHFEMIPSPVASAATTTVDDSALTSPRQHRSGSSRHHRRSSSFDFEMVSASPCPVDAGTTGWLGYLPSLKATLGTYFPTK